MSPIFLRTSLYGKSGGAEHRSAFHTNASGRWTWRAHRHFAEEYGRTTTTAHELAPAIIATSGIITLRRRPDYLITPPEVLKLFRDAPAAGTRRVV